MTLKDRRVSQRVTEKTTENNNGPKKITRVTTENKKIPRRPTEDQKRESICENTAVDLRDTTYDQNWSKRTVEEYRFQYIIYILCALYLILVYMVNIPENSFHTEQRNSIGPSVLS